MQHEGVPTITLSGDRFQCYKTGTHYGAALELKEVAGHMEKISAHQSAQLVLLRDALTKALPEDSPLRVEIQNLPSLAFPLESITRQMRSRAREHSDQGAHILRTMQKPGIVEGNVGRGLLWGIALTGLILVAAIGALVYAWAAPG